ncbi:exodeoxyribonuclease VII large subunit [Alteromonas sp. S015]|uniref:exodeoxyribonuclease VII large subunit n=1 Tax=Alteromonas sp. S015 TaxID=3117401 RepID=UPI002FDF37A3
MSVEKLVEVAKPLQKNQMYNWFDRYKSKEQQKVYILNSKPEETARLSLSLVKRLTERKT